MLLEHLPVDKHKELIKEFLSLFSDTPSQTHLLQHGIDVRNAVLVLQRFYHVS